MRTRGGKHRQERGAAVVEFALGATVFVTILMFGIHFAEVGFIALKVTEAANFALFDATGRQHHDTNIPTWGLYAGAASASEVAANGRYMDLDGRSSKTGGALHLEAMTKVVPQGNSLMKMRCETGAAADIHGVDPSRGGTLSNGINAPNTGNTGFACSAEAIVSAYGIPTSFLEQGGVGGFFSVAHSKPLNIHLCAVGQAYGGSCQNAGRFGILLDDWGWSGYAEGKNCHLNSRAGCANPGYFKVARNVYLPSRTGAAGTALVASVGGSPALTQPEDEFWMSFEGEDSPHGQPFMEVLDNGEHEGFTHWQTSPFTTGYPYMKTSYTYAWESRVANQGCFLGLKCP